MHRKYFSSFFFAYLFEHWHIYIWNKEACLRLVVVTDCVLDHFQIVSLIFQVKSQSIIVAEYDQPFIDRKQFVLQCLLETKAMSVDVVFVKFHRRNKRRHSFCKSRTCNDHFFFRIVQSFHKLFKMSRLENDIVVYHANIFAFCVFNAFVSCFRHSDVVFKLVISYIWHCTEKLLHHFFCIVCWSVVHDQDFMLDIWTDFI